MLTRTDPTYRRMKVGDYIDHVVECRADFITARYRKRAQQQTPDHCRFSVRWLDTSVPTLRITRVV